MPTSEAMKFYMIMPDRIVTASFESNASSGERCRDTKIATVQCSN